MKTRRHFRSNNCLYIIIIIRVARLLLKLGRGELSPPAQGLCRNGWPSTLSQVADWVVAVLERFGLNLAFGMGIKSMVLPRYRGPINRSLTDLLRRGMADVSGVGANL